MLYIIFIIIIIVILVKLSASLDLNCNNLIIMHGMENVKLLISNCLKNILIDVIP